MTTDRLSSKGNRNVETETHLTRFRFHNIEMIAVETETRYPETCFHFHNIEMIAVETETRYPEKRFPFP